MYSLTTKSMQSIYSLGKVELGDGETRRRTGGQGQESGDIRIWVVGVEVVDLGVNVRHGVILLLGGVGVPRAQGGRELDIAVGRGVRGKATIYIKPIVHADRIGRPVTAGVVVFRNPITAGMGFGKPIIIESVGVGDARLAKQRAEGENVRVSTMIVGHGLVYVCVCVCVCVV
jgi:hypothetical protein